MTSGRPILTLKGVVKPAALSAPSGITPAQTAVKGPETAAGSVRAGEDHKAPQAGPTASGASPIAAWKLKRGQALTWLAATHPAVFSADGRPLALGTGKSVWPAAKAAGIKRAAFTAAMKFHTGSIAYLDALSRDGAQRFDLEGNAIEPVSDEHRVRAIEMKVELARAKIRVRSAPNRREVSDTDVPED
jgi:ProQ/FINO family